MTSTRAVSTLPRAFWALWAGQLINRLGGFVQPFLVLYLTQEQRLSASTAGAVVAAVGAGTIAAQLLGGWLADRVGRRRTMLAGFLGTAVALVTLGAASSFTLIWVSALAVGVTSELFRPAASATVADLLGPEARVRAYGLLFWAVNLGFSISAVSAGVLASRGFGLLFWINASTCVIAALVIWRAVPETRPAAVEVNRRSVLRVAGADRPLLGIVAITTVYAAIYFQAYSTLPLAMAADGLSPSTYGLVIGANGLVIVVAQPLLIRVLGRYDRSTLLAVSMLVVGLGFGAGVFAHGIVGYTGSVVVWTLGEIGLSTVLSAIFADLAPLDLRGRYMGIAGVAWAMGSTVGPLAGTAVFEAAGSTVLWVGCAVIGVLLCLAQLALAPALRARAAAADQEAESSRLAELS
ncbi:MDR family MFS transporter [Actinopolymorpha alba]|uniref:MDR family MFS transporter n=1 Tax=Actinopolymorpha alba TaxID=533267 RepID=UPI00058D1061|nr:MFS transporter [Actinopolymorpha alba]